MDFSKHIEMEPDTCTSAFSMGEKNCIILLGAKLAELPICQRYDCRKVLAEQQILASGT